MMPRATLRRFDFSMPTPKQQYDLMFCFGFEIDSWPIYDPSFSLAPLLSVNRAGCLTPRMVSLEWSLNKE